MTTVHIDLETRSAVDLRKTGVYVYAADRTTDVWCAAWAVDDGPIELWTRDNCTDITKARKLNDMLAQVVHGHGPWKGCTIVAHNANFERVIWREILAKRYGWPEPKLESWRCTMAQAYAMSLPGSLDGAAAAMGLEQRKDMAGKDNMMRMARPRKPRKGELPNGLYWHDEPERKQRLYDYCKQDVEVERALDKRLLPLRPAEQRLWQLDQRINDRGIYVDVELCEAALKVVETATKWLNDEMRELTDGEVSATTNVGELGRWLSRAGFPSTSVDKEAIDDLLVQPGLPVRVRRVLQIRRESAKASVKKIDALLAGRNDDGRARGLLQFHAAGTGRWAGRRFQPQNIKRPSLKDVNEAIDVVATGSAEAVAMVYGEPLAVVGDCLRGMLRAAP